MSVSERYKYLSCCLIFKCLFDSNINNSSDDTFITNYKFTHETHQYKTRNNLQKCQAIPMPRTEYYKRSLLAHLWCAYAMALCLSWIVRREGGCVCVEHNYPKMWMD